MENLKTNAIRGRLGELKMSVQDWAKLVGLSNWRAYSLINGVIPYNAIDIKKSCEVLNIPAERIPDYFFDTVVSKLPTNANEREK